MTIIKTYLNNENGKEIDCTLKRCAICDSTEHYDTLKSHGINNPISFWISVQTEHVHEMRCNRCNDIVNEAEEFFTRYNSKAYKGQDSDIISSLDYLEYEDNEVDFKKVSIKEQDDREDDSFYL